MPLLLTLLLAFHLVAADLAAAGPLFSAWLGRRSLRGDDVAARLGPGLAWMSLGALALLGLSGGLLLLGPRGGALLEAAARFPQGAWWGVLGELLFSAVFSTVLLLAWRGGRFRPKWGWTAAVLTSSNLLYHFAPLMIIVGNLADAPQWTPEPVIERSAFRSLMMRAEVVSLWTHFVVAAVAVSGVAVVWLSRPRKPGPDSPEQGQSRGVIHTRAALVAAVATGLQLPVGLWVLVSLPTPAMEAYLGGSPLPAAAMAGGVVAGIWLFFELGACALGEQSPTHARRIVVLALASILLMSATLGVH